MMMLLMVVFNLFRKVDGRVLEECSSATNLFQHLKCQ